MLLIHSGSYALGLSGVMRSYLHTKCPGGHFACCILQLQLPSTVPSSVLSSVLCAVDIAVGYSYSDIGYRYLLSA
jgi:hypothetical protein